MSSDQTCAALLAIHVPLNESSSDILQLTGVVVVVAVVTVFVIVFAVALVLETEVEVMVPEAIVVISLVRLSKVVTLELDVGLGDHVRAKVVK